MRPSCFVPCLCHIECMPSVNLRQLRDTHQLKAWLNAGKTVELREQNRKLAVIVPEKSPKSSVKWPDAAARRKRIFSDRTVPAVEILIQDRESRY